LGVFKAPWILARVSSKLHTQSGNFRGSGVSRTSLISGGYEDTPRYWFTMYMSQTTKDNKTSRPRDPQAVSSSTSFWNLNM